MRILSSLRWGVVAALLALLIAPAAVALVTGTQLVVVDGKSMTPTYQFGDIVLIGAPHPDDFAPDHVVTVGMPNGEMYTHRIISIDDGKAQLKGDGNTAEDPDTVTYDQLVGAVRGHIGGPLAGILAYAQTLPARVSLAVLVVALIMLPLSRQRRTVDDEGDQDTPTPVAAEADAPDEPPSSSDDLDIFLPVVPAASSDGEAASPPPRRSRRSLQQW